MNAKESTAEILFSMFGKPQNWLPNSVAGLLAAVAGFIEGYIYEDAVAIGVLVVLYVFDFVTGSVPRARSWEKYTRKTHTKSPYFAIFSASCISSCVPVNYMVGGEDNAFVWVASRCLLWWGSSSAADIDQ